MNAIERELSQIPHFQFIHDHLFSSGHPSAAQLAQIKAYGVDTVINLAICEAQPDGLQQDQQCIELGLNYIQVPIDFEQPAIDQCLLVLDLIQHLARDKMLWIHCKDNQRASCLMYLYRQYCMQIDMPTAQAYLHEIWEPNNTWTGLMHGVALQLQGRQATQDLEQSLLQAQLSDDDLTAPSPTPESPLDDQ